MANDTQNGWIARGLIPALGCASTLLICGASLAFCGPAVTALGAQQSPTGTDPVSERVVRLDVAPVRQANAPLCGPAAIEMLFRYWGEHRYDQYDIARAILLQFREERRYRDAPALLELDRGLANDAIDWRGYPGTGTYYMREFLAPYAPTRNPRIKRLPNNSAEAQRTRDRFFRDLKGHLDSGSPVIVHQWYDPTRTSQHYRVVVGYDDRRQLVFGIDPRDGAFEMSNAIFLELWNVDEDWLPYNFIVFNAYAPGRVERGELRVEIETGEAAPGDSVGGQGKNIELDDDLDDEFEQDLQELKELEDDLDQNF